MKQSRGISYVNFAMTELASGQRDSLTGILYKDGNFLQVLEGPALAVKATLQRIELDDRHRGILVMKEGPIKDRSFSEWRMAFRDTSGASVKDIIGYSPFMEMSFEADKFRSKPDFANRMLLQFKKRLR
jgi:hypothetical protein